MLHSALKKTIDGFSFSSTLDRSLINRQAISEVFLTDFEPVSSVNWIVGAQLPLSHSYYSDHEMQAASYDPLLLLECARQAATFGGYKQFGSPKGTVNIVGSTSISIAHPELLLIGKQPGQLVLEVFAEELIEVKGQVRKVKPRITLFLDEQYVGDVTIQATLLSQDQFRMLRGKTRQGTLLTTNNLVETNAILASLESVKRKSAKNILLAGLERTSKNVQGLLRIMISNTSILDHEYDHVPAMALADAAMQMFTWDLGFSRERIGSMSATFHAFLEVDEQVLLIGTSISENTYLVEFIQSEQVKGSISLNMNYLK